MEELHAALTKENTVYLASFKETINDRIVPIKYLYLDRDRFHNIISKHWYGKGAKAWNNELKDILKNEGISNRVS